MAKKLARYALQNQHVLEKWWLCHRNHPVFRSPENCPELRLCPRIYQCAKARIPEPAWKNAYSLIMHNSQLQNITMVFHDGFLVERKTVSIQIIE